MEDQKVCAKAPDLRIEIDSSYDKLMQLDALAASIKSRVGYLDNGNIPKEKLDVKEMAPECMYDDLKLINQRFKKLSESISLMFTKKQ